MSDSDSNDGSWSAGEEGEERPVSSTTITSDVLAPTNKRKRKDVRRRIRKILAPEQLEVETVTAQKEEEERLRRLELQKSLNSTALQEARNSPVNAISPLDQSKHRSSPIVVDITRRPAPKHVILIDDSDDECDIVATKTYTGPVFREPAIEISDSESDQSDVSDDSVTEEPETSGSHTNDDVNQPDNQGRVLVNVNHPPSEPDIFLSPYLSSCVKPHQIGGIRFLYDNLVESLSRFEMSPGFGCILAHSMGLGKTLQVICFVDVLLSFTKAKKVLCIVPMNTIQNWYSEFNSWLPEETNDSNEIVMETANKTGSSDDKPPRTRKFKVFLFNDNVKTTSARSSLIKLWDSNGGVLLMGYEMYRILAMYSPSLVNNTKLTSSKRRKPASTKEVIDLDEEERNMDLLLDIQKALCKPGPDLVVCDEGHRIKNNQANISQALKKVNTRRRVVLTGYPLQNNLVEYWCMVDFVRPNFLGTRHEFANMFERPITNGQCVDSTASDIKLMRFRAHVLHSLLEGFVQRRSEAVLTKTLPEKEEYVIPVKMSPIQLSLYKEFVSSVKKYAGFVNPIKAFSMCIKIWNHPDILKSYLDRQKDTDRNDSPLTVQGDPDLDIGMKFINKRNKEQKNTVPRTSNNADSPALAPAADTKSGFATSSFDWVGKLLDGYEYGVMNNGTKMMILCEIIEKTVSLGEKLLVFSQSLSTLSVIEDFMRRRLVPPHPSQIIFQPMHWERNKNYYRLDGSTSSQEREKLIKAFNSKNNTSVFLFLLSTRACSLGVNLIGANRVVVFDASWNPCHDAQAVCRIYRYGQNKKCFIYRLVSFETFEKRMYERQITKEGMSDRVIDELNPDANLTKQEVMSLFNEGDVVSDDEKDDLKIAPFFSDQVLSHVCDTARCFLFQTPFKHKSQTSQKSKSNLTKAEKREARKAYEREKRAITANKFEPIYERNSALLREQMRREAVVNRPVVHVKPIQNVRPTTLTTKPPSSSTILTYPQSSLPSSSLTLPPLRSLATGDLLSNLPSMSYMSSLVPANPYARYFNPGELRPLPAFPPAGTLGGPVTNNHNGLLMNLLSTPSFHMTPSTSALNGMSSLTSSAVLSSQVTPSRVTSSQVLPAREQAAETVTSKTDMNADVFMPGTVYDLTDDVSDLIKEGTGVSTSGVARTGSEVDHRVGDDKLSISQFTVEQPHGAAAETVTSAPSGTGPEFAAE